MSGFGEEQLAPANGVELAYQEMGPADGEPLLLIMGLAVQMTGWDEEFCALLAERGFRVVRFDNRDIGHSTKLDWAGVPSRFDMALGRRSRAPYLLKDMADDTFGLMDRLGIASAHVAGISMGGMIGQTMAIRRPERVRSLASMSSTTGSRWVGQPSWRAFGVLLARLPRDREAYVRQAEKTFRLVGTPASPQEIERLRELAGQMYDRSHSSGGILRQMSAIIASGDRTRALRGVRAPTVVTHGSRDPLIRPSGGRATAKAIPGARLKIIEGMGHDLPQAHWPTLTGAIADNAARAAQPAPVS